MCFMYNLRSISQAGRQTTPRWTSITYRIATLSLSGARKNGKVWIPNHSITTVYLPISCATHPTYIKEEKGRRRSTPLDVKIAAAVSKLDVNAGRQLDSKLDVRKRTGRLRYPREGPRRPDPRCQRIWIRYRGALVIRYWAIVWVIGCPSFSSTSR